MKRSAIIECSENIAGFAASLAGSIIAATMILITASLLAKAQTQAERLLRITGGVHAKAVWVRSITYDDNCNPLIDHPVGYKHVITDYNNGNPSRLVLLDTKEGKERIIDPQLCMHFRPFFTRSGKYVIWNENLVNWWPSRGEESKKLAMSSWILNVATGEKKLLIKGHDEQGNLLYPGYAMTPYYDKRTKTEWIYHTTYTGGRDMKKLYRSPLIGSRLDTTKAEVVFERQLETKIGQLGVTGDGKFIGGNFPWPIASAWEVEKSEFMQVGSYDDATCFSHISPDNSYIFGHSNKGHSRYYTYRYENGTWKLLQIINTNELIGHYEVFRWSNHRDYVIMWGEKWIRSANETECSGKYTENGQLYACKYINDFTSFDFEVISQPADSIKVYDYVGDLWLSNGEGPMRDDSIPPSAPSGLNLEAPNPFQVVLTWQVATDNKDDIFLYRIYRNSALVKEVSPSFGGLTFTDDVDESTTYQYAVSAVDGAMLEGPKTAQKSITTPADTEPPTITNISAVGTATIVALQFSEKVEETSAEIAANYAVDNGITVSAAKLGADEKSVALTVSSMTADVTYTLAVNNIKDLSKAANTVAAGTKVTFSFVPKLLIADLTAASGAAYEIDELKTGQKVYIDRDFTFSDIPAAYAGFSYIRTANNDKSASGQPFLSFGVNQPVTVYVGLDSRATSAPSWLSGFEKKSDVIKTSDVTFNVYSRTFPAGTIELGPNNASSMYTVVLGTLDGAMVNRLHTAAISVDRISIALSDKTLRIAAPRMHTGRVRVLSVSGRLIAEAGLHNGAIQPIRLRHHGAVIVSVESQSGRLVKREMIICQ